MKSFIIERTDAEIVSHSGFALVGRALHNHSGVSQAVDHHVPLRHGISHSDNVVSYIGLICTGKSDFDAIENVRDDMFFSEALGVETVPSAATLRQRMDKHAEEFLPLVEEASIAFLSHVGAHPTALASGHVALDVDVTPMDNSKTKKEGVSRTYKGHDGYAPIAAYVGSDGYCVGLELREGAQHCQKDTPQFLQRVLPRARQLTEEPLLLRLDGGNDALDNVDVVLEHNETDEVGVDFLIKWNPRKQSPEHWLDYAIENAWYDEPRKGKRVWVFDVQHERSRAGYDYSIRRVMRVTERTIDKKGQALLVAEVTIEGWWTSLSVSNQVVIDLYSDHGTSEQFHSEFKTDLDIERLPSGKFETNKLVLACASLSYNILRWIGQTGLTQPGGPVRHPAKRRRLRTVMQELMCLAARFIRTGRRLKLGFSRNCRAVEVFESVYAQLAPA